MRLTLGSLIAEKSANNLNSIRLILAVAVVFSHSFLICKSHEPLVSLSKGQLSFGEAAVNLFFFLSGMLITASWLRSPTMQAYLMKRFLRIYPGYIGGLCFSAIVVWVFCPEFREAVGRGISWGIKFGFDCFKLTFESLAWEGIFPVNPFPLVANGSLWTIQKEFYCYLLVALIGVFGMFKHRWLVLLAALGVTAFHYTTMMNPSLPFSGVDLRLACYFLLGACAWLWRDCIPVSRRWATATCLTLVLVAMIPPWFAFLFPFAASYLVIWFGYGVQSSFMAWTRSTDLSYGVYLYAWPIQQVLAMDERIRHPWTNFVLTLPIVFIFALLSWKLIEERFLQLKGFVPRDYDPAEKPVSQIDAVRDVVGAPKLGENHGAGGAVVEEIERL